MDIAFTPGRKVNFLPQYLLVAKPKGVAAEIVADTGRNRFGDRTCTLRLLEDSPAVTLQGFHADAIAAGTVIDAYDRQVREDTTTPRRYQVIAYATAFYHKRIEVSALTPQEAGHLVHAQLKDDIGDGWTSLPELSLPDSAPFDFDIYAEGDPDFEPEFGQ